MTPEPIERASAVELCAASLRNAVLSGAYEEGARLPPERALAVKLGVNRVTVRGALAALVKEGLLSVRQGSGYEVQDYLGRAGLELLPSLTTHLERNEGLAAVADLLAVRRAIASVVLERLKSQRVRPAQLEKIEAAIERLATAPERERANADLAVLEAVVAATGSPAFRLVLNPIGKVLNVLPGLKEAMFRRPEENVLGWHALVEWLRSSERAVAPLLELLSLRDDETMRALRRTR